MHVIPQHDVVRDPDDFTKLPPEGKEVPDNRYWRRRVAVGDVIISAPKSAPAKKTSKTQESQ